MDKHCAGFLKELLGGAVLHNLEVEALRGCQSFVHPHPVRLEPGYQEFRASQTYADARSVKLSEPLTRKHRFCAYHLLFPLPESVPWELVGQAVACLSGFPEPFSFEIVGNASGISYYLALARPGLATPVTSVLQKFEPDVEVFRHKPTPWRALPGRLTSAYRSLSSALSLRTTTSYAITRGEAPRPSQAC